MQRGSQIKALLAGATLSFGATAANSNGGMQTYTYLQLHQWATSDDQLPEISALHKYHLHGFRTGVSSTLNILSAFDRNSIKAHTGKRICLPKRDLTGKDIHEDIILAVGPYDYDRLLKDVNSQIGYGPAAGAAISGLEERFPCESGN